MEFICAEAAKVKLCLAPKHPAQPPQSPDLNPLDTFLLFSGVVDEVETFACAGSCATTSNVSCQAGCECSRVARRSPWRNASSRFR